jgi:ferrous iron transport protein A
MTLDAMRRGMSGRVISVETEGRYGLRLMELGVVPGADVRIVKTAPLGDPIQICLRDSHLALRRSEAQSITVAVTGD